MEKYKESIAEFEKVLSINPNNVESLCGKGSNLTITIIGDALRLLD